MNDRLSSLKRRVAALEGGAGQRRSRASFAVGAATLDGAFGGGLEQGALHEAFADTVGDLSAASGFAVGLAMRAAGERPIVWVRHDYAEVEGGGLYGPGLMEFGLDPGRLILVRAGGPADVLRAGAEAAVCKPVGAVVIEVWGASQALDLTATRRLSLAAAASGVTLLMVRVGAVAPGPSAAITRWSVAAAHSAALEGNAAGGPTFAVTLQRHRGGIPERRWIVEWDRDQGAFKDAAAVSGGVVSAAAGRPGSAQGEAGRWRAAG